MIISLIKKWVALHYWNHATNDSVERMQLRKFRKLFEYAKENSKFYREYYKECGVINLQINHLADIAKVPIINKTILRQHSVHEIMTCDMNERIHIHSTSGSSGEPFKIAIDKNEDYIAHVRVLWALKKAGYRTSDTIAIVARYSAGEKFEIENDLSILGRLQRKLKLFHREIISIYEPVDEIISKLKETTARVLWSTPSVMNIVGNRLKERGIKFDFPIIFLTSEVITSKQKELFKANLGQNIVNLYGAMESPSLGFDFGLVGRFTIFPNSSMIEFDKIHDDESGNRMGNVIVTNFENKTMPFIRYDLNDSAEIEDHPCFGRKYIKNIFGRLDDIIELNNGKPLVHHHVYEMFRDFQEAEMYKFVQKPDKSVRLQLKIAANQDQSLAEKKALKVWGRHFSDVPLLIEFVKKFDVNPNTGKFKNIEIE